MRCTITKIRKFYASSLGKIVHPYIQNVVNEFLPLNIKNKTILGFGYTTPYIKKDYFNDNNVFVFMPDFMGAESWPNDLAPKTSLVHDWMLPLTNQSVDYLIIIHGGELCTNIQAFFKEVSRVLGLDGKILMIIPNRQGVWARIDNTPFGFGHPYTMSQANQLLADNGFFVESTKHLLYFPPTQSKFIQSFIPSIEFFGKLCMQKISGLNAIVATKKTPSLLGYLRKKEFIIPLKDTLPNYNTKSRT